jgi:hypothetical protein
LDNLNGPKYIYVGGITRWRGGGSSSSSGSAATTDTERELLRRWRRDGPIWRRRRQVQNPVVYLTKCYNFILEEEEELYCCKAPRCVSRGILQLIQLPPPEIICKGFGVCVEGSARGPVRDAVQRELRENIAHAAAFAQSYDTGIQ